MSNHDPHATPHTDHEIEHEVETIHVPRGKSRARYVMTIILLIFILIIFVVSDLFQSAFSRSGGSSGDQPFMEWTHPSGGTRSVGARDFVLERRRTEDFYRVLGVDRKQMRDLTSDENIARNVIMDELAREAGVEFTDAELKALIKQRFGDSATYRGILDAVHVSASDFQDELRRVMRINRYQSLVGDLLAQPDPAEIESAWKKQHTEHSLQVATFRVSSDDPEVALNLPDDAGVKAWYDGLDAMRKRSLFSADWRSERASAELAYFNFESGDATALLAAFPRPEGTDLEQLAKDYHNQFAHLRFRRPEEKADATDARERLYFTFDEVADRARAESQVHAALVDWSNALRARIAQGETVDIASEAVAMGLSFFREATPKSQLDWSTMPDLGAPALADGIMRAARGDKFVSLLVTDKLIVLGRVTERVESGAPPYEEIADRALIEWRKEKAVEVARARADKLFIACQPPKIENLQPQATADAESFAAKAQEVGVEVVDTGWIDQSNLPTDVLAEDPDIEHFKRELRLAARSALQSVPDAVLGPYTSTDKSRIFVVRYVGSREPETLAIEPREFQGLRQTAERERQREVGEDLFGVKGIERSFGMRFPGRVDNEIPPEAGIPPEEQQG